MTLDEAIGRLRAVDQAVPAPARLPSVAEVDAVERRLGVPLPADLRRYLLEASDVTFGAVEPVTITLPGAHTDLVDLATAAWDTCGVPKNLVPICEANADYY